MAGGFWSFKYCILRTCDDLRQSVYFTQSTAQLEKRSLRYVLHGHVRPWTIQLTNVDKLLRHATHPPNELLSYTANLTEECWRPTNVN